MMPAPSTRMAPKGSRSSIASGSASTALASCGVSKAGSSGNTVITASYRSGEQGDAQPMRRPRAAIPRQRQQQALEEYRLAAVLEAVARIVVAGHAEARGALDGV